MKLTKLLSSAVLFSAMTISGLLTSCQSDIEPPKAKIDVENISRQVRQAINDEIALAELSDTISFQTSTDSALTSVSRDKRPIVINELDVIVENDEYSQALKQYNKRLDDGRNFALKLIFIIIPFLIVTVITAGLFIFLYKRTLERNKLIDNAIRNNYHLPDSFYENNSVFNLKRSTAASDNGQTPPPVNRDQRSFKQGITYICVGVGIMIFFFSVGAPKVAALSSIIVLFGVSRLITYYHD